MSKVRGAALTAAAGAAVISTSGVLIMYADASPATVAFFRGLYALPPLLVLAYVERRRRGSRTRASHLCSWAAGLLLGATFLFQNASIALVGVGITTVVGNLQVLVVTFAGWLLFRERPGGRFLAALPVALAGVVLVSGVLDEDAYGIDPSRGIVLCLATSLAYAGFLLTLRQGQRGGDRHLAGPLAEATAAAALVSLVGAPLFGGVDLTPHLPSHGWLLLLALGPQVLGWLLISGSMHRLPVAMSALALLLQPLLAVILGMTLLSENPSTIQLVGCVILLAAVIFGAVSSRSHPPTVAAEPENPLAPLEGPINR